MHLWIGEQMPKPRGLKNGNLQDFTKDFKISQSFSRTGACVSTELQTLHKISVNLLGHPRLAVPLIAIRNL